MELQTGLFEKGMIRPSQGRVIARARNAWSFWRFLPRARHVAGHTEKGDGKSLLATFGNERLELSNGARVRFGELELDSLAEGRSFRCRQELAPMGVHLIYG
jgi:hypothetical protein